MAIPTKAELLDALTEAVILHGTGVTLLKYAAGHMHSDYFYAFWAADFIKDGGITEKGLEFLKNGNENTG